MEVPDPSWLVDGLVPKGVIGQLFGATDSMKTFMMLDLALSVSTGEPWLGRKVEQGPAVYVVAEALAGYRRRVRAWLEARGKASG